MSADDLLRNIIPGDTTEATEARDRWRGMFVERDGNGAIKGAYCRPQPGLAEEPVAEDDAGLVAFMAKLDAASAPKPDPRLAAIEAELAGLKARLDKVDPPAR